ncbi:MAG: AraC-like DNA-binding protein [Oceanicoccus sp.]|jgi:AraC-like DNA-binding protein
MPLDIDEAVIPLAHIDNYFVLRKVLVAHSELRGNPYKTPPSWACSTDVLRITQQLEPRKVYPLAGIDTSQRSSNTLITIRQCMKIVNLVKRILPGHHLGLSIGKLMTLSHHGQAGIAVATQDTIKESIIAACRLGGTLFPALKYNYQDGDGYSSVFFEGNVSDQDFCQFFLEINMASFYHIFKYLTSNQYEAKFVRFSCPEPAHSHIYKHFFNCPVEFSADKTELGIPTESLKQVMPLANRFIALSSEKKLIASLPIPNKKIIINKLEKIILKTNGEFHSLESAAEVMGMSGRTLRRKLSEEGSSYQKVLNEVRCQLAQKLLRLGRESITDIAFLLGFADTSAFTKAFKRWTNKSPREYKIDVHGALNRKESLV